MEQLCGWRGPLGLAESLSFWLSISPHVGSGLYLVTMDLAIDLPGVFLAAGRASGFKSSQEN